MAYENDILTRNDNDELAVRTVQSVGDNPASSYDDVYTRDNNGKLAVRVVGGGGGGSVDYNRVVEKIAVIPSAESSTVGKVYMYDGVSNATYTHGYIYECVATQQATAVAFSGSIISSWDVADFVSYLQEGGSAYNEVTHGILTYDASGNLWDLVGYDANGIEVMSFHEYTEDLEDFGCVFASETHQDGDNCTFTLTTTVDGKRWKRLDVQPGGEGGGGGSDPHNLGWYATESALTTAHPTANDGDWAIVGSTDTVWVWDSDTNAWKDTDQKGQVESVNGKTGAVVLNAYDVGAIPQYSSMPEPNQAGDIVQYTGTTNQNYTNGYFYKSVGGSGYIITDGELVGDFTSPDPFPTITFNKSTFESYLSQNEYNELATKDISLLISLAGDDENVMVTYNYTDETREYQFVVPLEAGATYSDAETFLSSIGFSVDLSGMSAGDVYSFDGYLPTSAAGYSWTRIDVQPAGPGGGIEWKTSIDLPQSVSGSPLLTIPNGLSDGTYEFYYQFKNPNANRSYPDYFITYKIIFSLNNGVVNANVCYVIDGDYFTIDKKIESTSITGGWFVSGNDIKIFLNAWQFVSDYRNYGISDEIKDCYKFSAIKNIETGDEYIGTGEVTSYPSTYDSSIPAYYLFAALQSEPYIPSFYDDNYFNLEETEYLCLDKFISGDVYITPGASKLYFSMFARSKGVFQATVDLNAGEYVLTVHKATGVFENTILSKSSSNYIWVEINAPAGSTGRFYVQSSGVGRDSFSVLDQTPDEQLTPLNVNQVGGNITETNFGKILQYTGATNANYTNGYFYKANGTPVVIPTSLECTNTSTTYPGTVITCNDADDLISALMTRTGQDYDWVYTNLSFSSFNINPNTNNVYWSAWGSFTDASIVALFTFTPVPAGNITFDVQVIAQYTEIQNSSWDRVDVQPASSGGLPSQTGNSGKFLITNGIVASWGTTVEDYTLVIKNSQTSMYGGYPNQITFYSKYNGSDGTGASIQSGNNGSLVLSASSIAATGAIYPSGSVNLGLDTQSGAWNTVYARNLGNRSSSYIIRIPEATAGVLAVQVSNMPTADSTRVGQIYQFIGTTGTYTHGYFYECVSDGGNPATYSWSAINVQAGGGGSSTATTALLDELSWVNNSQTVNVTGVTASNNVIVSAAPASQSDYSACGIICTAQGAGTLTFTCDSVPTTGITVNVLII